MAQIFSMPISLELVSKTLTSSSAVLTGADLSGASLDNANLLKADLKGANFYNPNSRYVIKEAIGLTVTQILQAKNWQQAKYSQRFRQKLGLPKNNHLENYQ